MLEPELRSIPGIVEVERLDGVAADPRALPSLLIEVPHGADQRAHYDALRARLVGKLPEDLHLFFHVNTDIGAWQLGRRVAARVIEEEPSRSALVCRCLLPRTFVDTNRVEQASDRLAEGGLTAAIAPYVEDPRDRALLVDLHRRYAALTTRAFEAVLGAGGFALLPHSYGPRTMGIERVDAEIVSSLRRAHEPEAWASWPLRPEIELITRTPEGERRAPEALVQALLEAYRALGLQITDSEVYNLHPATQAARWAQRFSEQTLCLEIRRDRLVESYEPFTQMRVNGAAVDRLAEPLVEAIDAWFRARR